MSDVVLSLPKHLPSSLLLHIQRFFSTLARKASIVRWPNGTALDLLDKKKELYSLSLRYLIGRIHEAA
jgi:hypothetical protein